MTPAVSEAIILAGGFGTRLRNVVSDVPKPLAPVCGRPFLAWTLDALAAQGVRRVVLATGYLAEKVEEALGTSWRSMELVYSREPEPLGTGGAVALACTRLEGGSAFVVNGDTWLELDYRAFAERSLRDGARLGMALAHVPDVARYGAVELDQGRVSGFSEKGRHGAGYINAGVYWFERTLMHAFDPGARFSFETDVLLPMASRDTVVAYTDTSQFIDIGVPEDYRRAQLEFLNRSPA